MPEQNSKKFELKILSPKGTAYDQQVSFMKLNTANGELGILPNHSALLTELVPGELEVIDEHEKDLYFIPRGFAHVHPDKVVILTPYVEHVSTIDYQRAKVAKKRAEEELKMATDDISKARANLALSKSNARIEIVEKEKITK
tara:strand:+ start:77 stop:505 length:429 start_codon:yes stop_codon:yes gene_type:complete